LKNIAAKEQFAAFSLHYLDNPVPKVMWNWKQEGKPVWQLIDPVDSLHPSQVSQCQKLNFLFSVNDMNTALHKVNSLRDH
jgi:hypothetical protein